ncbi:MAG: WD40 repeat domain-containing protein, partial [Zavarzinella sp.]|nr:WD40 repeat domain-containing protein [Zavarzinella sp.]
RIDRPKSHCTAFGFTPDSKRLAYLTAIDEGRDHILRLADATDGHAIGKELREPNGNTFSNSHALAFSPDGKRLAVGTAYNADTPNGWKTQILRWEVARDGTEFRKINPLPRTNGMAKDMRFAPDGDQLLAVTGTSAVVGWSWATGQEDLRTDYPELITDLVAVGKSHAAAGAWVPASLQATVADWRLDPKASGPAESNPPMFPVALASVAFSPDDSLLAAGTKGLANIPWEQLAAVHIWERQTGGERAVLLGHADWVLDVAFTPDGKKLVSASKDGTVRTWRLP